MTYIIDIDNTICKTEGADYVNAKPYFDRIKQINKLYDERNEIIYYTSRGTISGINWKELTEKQFKQWNVKYTKLLFGKIQYDYWVDDKSRSIHEFFGEADGL
jgi:hypothetical protein